MVYSNKKEHECSVRIHGCVCLHACAPWLIDGVFQQKRHVSEDSTSREMFILFNTQHMNNHVIHEKAK